MSTTSGKRSVFIVAALCAVAVGQTSLIVQLPAQDLRSKGVFELVVINSSVLKPGASSIVSQSALVTLVHGLVPGNSDGLEVEFFTNPLTEAGKSDILNNDAKELRKSSHATLVLFLDKGKKVWQADLSIVVPGTTVSRPVAWKPDELASYFSNYTFDGKRLVLKSKGNYSELESGQEKMKLSWNVDLDLPVFDKPKR